MYVQKKMGMDLRECMWVDGLCQDYHKKKENGTFVTYETQLFSLQCSSFSAERDCSSSCIRSQQEINGF